MKLAAYLVSGGAALVCILAPPAQAGQAPPPLVLAQQAPSPSTGADESEDVARDPLTADDFVYLAGSTLLFEIETARAALNRAASPDVRAFAERILQDRDGLLRDLRAASAAGKVPDALDDENRKIVDALASEQGAQFDTSFLGMMIDTHEETLDLHEEFTESVKDERLRAYVDAATPRITAFLKEAEALEQKVKPADQR